MADSSSDDDSSPEPSIQPTRMTPEIEQMLSQATGFYFIGQFSQAVELLNQIITRAPTVPDPLHLLGRIKEELGEKEKAAQFYLLYAQLTRHDVNLWVKVAHMYKDLMLWKDASYCFGRALMNSHQFEPDIMKERAQCFENLGKFPKAAQIYQKVLESDEDPDPLLAKSYLQVLEISNKLDQGPTVLERVLTRIYKNDLMNLLAELYLKLGKYEKCLDFVRTLGREGYPIEIEVRVAVCVAKSGKEQEAEPVFSKLSKISVHHYPDLYQLVGDAYRDLGKPETALQFYEPLRAVPDFDTPELWLKCAKLYEYCDDDLSAEEAYQMVLDSEAVELNSECKIQLSRLYMRIGDREKALKVLIADEKTEMEARCRLDMEKASMYQLEGDLEGYYEAAKEAVECAMAFEAQNQVAEDGEKDPGVWAESHQSAFLDFALTLQSRLLFAQRFSEVLRLNASLARLSLFRSE